MISNAYCEIYFVRHGLTDWNAQGLLQGHNDIPLNHAGIGQAHQLRERLIDIPFAAAFSSDLARAKETAQIILHGRPIPLLTDPALREMVAGPFEGKKGSAMHLSMNQAFAAKGLFSKKESLSYQWHPEVETASQMYTRTKSFLQKQIPFYFGKPVLVVSHGGIIRAWLDHLDFCSGHKWIVHNCGFIHLKAKGEEFILAARHEITQVPLRLEEVENSVKSPL